jgi:transposase
VKSAEVVDFLAALLRHRITRDFIASQNGRLWVEYLPGYAPELNPVEYIWAYWKQHTLRLNYPSDVSIFCEDQ